MKCWVGIDPGNNGCGCLLYEDNSLRIIGHGAISQEVLYHGQIDRIVVEKVASSPQMGVSSAFKFGQSYGYILGQLESTPNHYELVTPQVWQFWLSKYAAVKFKNSNYSDQLKKTQGPARKRILKDIAKELFSFVKVNLKNADAILLALYAKETYGRI